MIDDLLALMFREEWRDLPEGPGQPWTAVAAALNAGEPGRARRLLAAIPEPAAADTAAVAAVLGRLAEVFDRNWFPGGEAAVLTDDDVDVLLEQRAIAELSPRIRPLLDVAGFVEAVPTWRRLMSAGADNIRVALDDAQTKLNRMQRADRPATLAPAALTVADLHHRAGLPESGMRLYALARQTYDAMSDRVGAAACELALGDWVADLDTRPETLAELLEPRPTTHRPAGDPQRAEAHWAAAEALYRAAGADRGMVAVAVRRAARAVADGRPHGAVAALAAVTGPVAATGDGALTQLVAVHHTLASVQAGLPVDVEAVADGVTAWAGLDGSRSYARGLAQLCRARAVRWQPADIAAARAAELLARRVFEAFPTQAETVTLSADQIGRYGMLNLRRAALVLTMAELDSSPVAPAGLLQWASRAMFVETASSHASALREPAVLERIDAHARALLRCLPDDGGDAPADLADGLRRIVAETPVLGPLWRATAARKAAEPELAQELLLEAEKAAQHSSSPMLLLSVLVAAGRLDEAAGVAARLERQGLPDEYAAVLNVRVGRFDAALAALDRIERRAGPGLPMQPWELPQARAEALLGVGRPHQAVNPSRAALAAVEHRLAGLGLDVFRSMAGDDPVVAGVFTTAVRVEAALGQADGDRHTARSFELSDRSRAAGLGDLLHHDPSADEDTLAAVRAWQRAGASLARTIEEVSAHLGGPDTLSSQEIRDGIAGAERTLDAAQPPTRHQIRRRTLPETPPLAKIQGRLNTGTLLLQYHAYDDRLVAWAVTPNSARVVVERYATADLTAAAFVFHRAASRRGVPSARLAELAAPLAPLLLPFAGELQRCDRVVVVPHGPLTSVPFHLLPFAGGPLGSAHRPVSYLPAASVAPDRPTGVRAGARVFIAGDPAYGGGLTALPGTRQEALDVARRWGTEPCLGPDVNRATLLAALPGADLVHLATHGSFREGSPYSTELALSGTDGLTVPDLMGLGLRADLVVLSACDSGRGRPTAAGDLVGLTRALLAAGARELVVSLWPVDDWIACLTMTAFHERLKARPGSVGQALAAAQEHVRSLEGEEHGPARRRTTRDLGGSTAGRMDPADACHWAPFVHIGTS